MIFSKKHTGLMLEDPLTNEQSKCR